MKNKWFLRVWLVFLLAALLITPLLAGCKSKEPSGNVEKVVFKASTVVYFPRTKNPFAALSSKQDQVCLTLVYEPLIYIEGTTGEIIPVLAKSWEYDGPNKTWIMHLNEKAKFRDGTPVTASDVKYSWETAWNAAAQFADSKALIDSIQVGDPQTVKFVLKAPNVSFMEYLTSCHIVPQAIWTTVGDIVAYKNEDPIGSGPFIWGEMVQDDHVTFNKNPDYWNGASAIDQVILKCYGTAEGQLLGFRKGEVDAISDILLNTSVPELLQDKNIKVDFAKLNFTQQLLLNLRVEPFNILEFRQAMNIIIDRRAIVEQALSGYGSIPMQIPIADSVECADKSLKWPYEMNTTAERLAMANAKLDAIPNMTAKGSDGIRSYKDKKLIFNNFLFSSTTPESVAAAKIIMDNLLTIGVKFNSTAITFTAAYAKVYRHLGKDPLGWDAFITGAPYFPSFVSFPNNWILPAPAPLSEGGVWQNPLRQSEAAGWTNKAIQDMFLLEAQEADPVKRLALEYQIENLWVAQLPELCLYHTITPITYRIDRFTGWIKGFGGLGGFNIPSTVSVVQIMKL
ncbi:MAG: ABC transporter substrate-binding protein, partial [Chloroflexi bacterium]|nr:ABC transporter substrate-binding protein [Chloroflexota bacterium]